MITILRDGKTYKVHANFIPKVMDKWLEEGYVEEVKERPTGDKSSPLENHSILEKLREWVDKELKLQGYEHQEILYRIDDLTTSLENSSEIPNSSPISKMETTQFTPGQEEQVILPEGAIPRFLHSQFPNNKPGKN